MRPLPPPSPADRPERPDRLRRVALVAGTGSYDHADEWEPLDQVRAALGRVADRLQEAGYEVGDRPYLLDPTRGELEGFLGSVPPDAGVVVAYYTGHGFVDGKHYLVPRDATKRGPRFVRGTAFPTRELPDLLAVRDQATGDAVQPQPYLLVVIDTCFAGAAALEIARDALADVVDPERTWVIVSARDVQYAQQGRFAEELDRAVREAGAGRTQRYLHPDVLVGMINEELPAWQEARSHPPATGSRGVPPFFCNPEYEPVPVGITLADQAHWLARARGAEGASGFYISGGDGRTRAARDLAAFLTSDSGGGLAVVTGDPGSGKSALLSLPALLADRAHRAELLDAAGERPIVEAVAQLVAPAMPVVSVHARGLNAGQIAARLAGRSTADAVQVTEVLQSLADAPGRHPAVVVDALDEAVEPAEILRKLLLRLPELGYRVIIGARRHVVESLQSAHLRIDLDEEPYADAEALRGYVVGLLTAGEEDELTTPYQGMDGDDVALVADAVVDRAGHSFLIGGMIALALRSAPEALDLARPDWRQEIPTDVGSAFDADLVRLGVDEPRVRTLLTALAWAKGQGLPWENLWVPVAEAVAAAAAAERGEAFAGRLAPDDVRVLRERAGSYVIEDSGPGERAVFRPFHDLLAAHLRRPPAGVDEVTHRRAVSAAIAEALIELTPRNPAGERPWLQAHPYVRAYLAAHLQDADQVGEFLEREPEFLAVADPATFLPLTLTPGGAVPTTISTVYRRVAPLLSADVSRNAAHLQESAVALREPHLADAMRGGSLAASYRTLLALWPEDKSLLTLPAHRGTVLALATLPRRGQAPLLVSSGDDMALRLWDLSTGRLVTTCEMDGNVYRLVPVPGPDGSTRLAGIGSRGLLHLWDTDLGHLAQTEDADGRVEGHAAVLLPLPHGRTCLVTSVEGGGVRLWRTDLRPLTYPPPPPLPGVGVEALLAVPLPDGRTVLAVGDRSGSVWLWDPATGRVDRLVDGQNGEGISALASVPGPDGWPLLATAVRRPGTDPGALLSTATRVELWDIRTGRPSVQVDLPLLWLNVLVAVPVEPDGVLLAAGGSSAAVDLLDPTTGAPARQPLTGHRNWVTAVLPFQTPDGPRLATAGDDGVVRLWSTAPSSSTGDVAGSSKHEELDDSDLRCLAVTSLPDGQKLLLVAGDRLVVTSWDPDAIERGYSVSAVRAPLTTSVTTAQLPDGRVVAVTADVGGLDAWELPSARHLGHIRRRPGRIRAVSTMTWQGDTPAVALIVEENQTQRVEFRELPTGRAISTLHRRSTRTVLDVLGNVGRAARGQRPLNHFLTSSPVALASFTLRDGRQVLAVGTAAGAVPVVDVVALELVGPPRLEMEIVPERGLCSVLEPDGTPLLVAFDPTDGVVIWDPLTGRQAGKTLVAPRHASSVRAFGPVLATGHGGHDAGGPLIAAAGHDDVVRIWTLMDRRLVLELRPRARVEGMAFAAPNQLAILSGEGVSVIEIDITRAG